MKSVVALKLLVNDKILTRLAVSENEMVRRAISFIFGGFHPLE